MNFKKNVNPIKTRRVSIGLSQKDMADRLGLTQSQYSRIESAKTEPTKHIDELGKIFGCLPEEVFGNAILEEMEREYLTDTSKTQRIEYHEKRSDAVYVNLKGWFSKTELDLMMDAIDQGFSDIRRWKWERVQDDFKQKLADSIARARVEADERVRTSVDKKLATDFFE